MRRTIIRNPEDAPSRAIRLLLHNQIHKLVVGCYSRCLLADSEEFSPVDIPSGEIGQGAFSLVFKLHKPWLMRQGTDTDEFSVSGLNTGLFIGTDHVFIGPQGGSLENAEIEIQDASGPFCEERVPRKKPGPMRPRPYSVAVEITPNSGYADGHHDATHHCLSGDVGGTEARKGEA